MAIYLRVKNPEGVVWEGEADQISSSNKAGKFDIFDDHANFISLIQESLVIKKGGKVDEIKVNNAVLKAKENKIFVYLGVKK